MKNVLFLSAFLSFNIFAHGENMQGPHGGFIRMPGPFHVELVLKDKAIFNVYLMNVNNSDAKVDKSFVLLNYKNGNQSINFDCKPATDHFECKTDRTINLNVGSVSIKAKRLDNIGEEAKFELPLTLKK